jgi:hypothetical protein
MTLTVTTDRALIYQTIIGWIKLATGFDSEKVIFLNQEITRPAKPYVGIIILSRGIKTGIDESRSSFDADTQKIQRLTTGPRQMVVQLEVYTNPSESLDDTEADEVLENILLTLDTEAVKDLFRTAKIGQLTQTPINRLDEQLGERWERRAQADVTITYSGESFDDGETSGNWIETVDYDINADT